MSIRPEDYSETDAPARRRKGNKRPRSKERPLHSDAESAFVVAVDRGRFRLTLLDSGSPLSAVKARELGKGAIVVGDHVDVVGDLSGNEGTLARIVRVQPRRSALRRTPDDIDPSDRVVVANADTMGIVTATAEPQPRAGFIDRCLVAAYDAGVRPLIVITKSDLAPVDELESTYSALDVPLIRAGRMDPLEDVIADISGQVTVLIGQSGVGKSTLVNRLVPDADRDTGRVNEVTGRGRHTSTSMAALELSGGGWIIDTPGLRSFGLAHVDLNRVLSAFPNLSDAGENCPRACNHLPPDCALDEWLNLLPDDQAAGPRNTLASLRRLIESREDG